MKKKLVHLKVGNFYIDETSKNIFKITKIDLVVEEYYVIYAESPHETNSFLIGGEIHKDLLDLPKSKCKKWMKILKLYEGAE